MTASSTPSIVTRLVRQCCPSTGNAPAIRTAGGGSINRTYQVVAGEARLFCKVSSATEFPHMPEKEARSLEALRGKGFRTPEVIGMASDETEQALLLEWIEPGIRTAAFWKGFGARLAALHAVRDDRFGWQEDNYMGSVPQRNTRSGAWLSFFIGSRLQPMVRNCREANRLDEKTAASFERLYAKLPSLFDADTKPALLHGDLWSGNFLCDTQAAPVLIDPCVYFGHPSMDLGMTTLFGGFDPGFYEAYHYHAPLPGNHREQWAVCNLYPLLVHLLLFGNSYLPSICQTLKKFS